MLVMTRICAKSATVIRMKCANLELIFSLRHVHLCFSFTASLYSQVLPAVSAIHLYAACTAERGPDSLSGLTGAINCTRNSGGKKTNYKCDVRRRTRARVNLPEFPTWDPVPLHFSVSKVVFFSEYNRTAFRCKSKIPIWNYPSIMDCISLRVWVGRRL